MLNVFSCVYLMLFKTMLTFKWNISDSWDEVITFSKTSLILKNRKLTSNSPRKSQLKIYLQHGIINHWELLRLAWGKSLPRKHYTKWCGFFSKVILALAISFYKWMCTGSAGTMGLVESIYRSWLYSPLLVHSLWVNVRPSFTLSDCIWEGWGWGCRSVVWH
jgi:hypothetical protein